MSKAFATRLNALLEQRRMSGRALAREMDVDKMTVCRWRRGTHEPQPTHLCALAAALQVPVAALLTDEEVAQVHEAPEEAQAREVRPAQPGSGVHVTAVEPVALIDRFAALELEPFEKLRDVVPDLMEVLAEARDYARRHRESDEA